MKKVFLLLLALILCLSVTACNGDGEQAESTEPVEKTTAPGKVESDTYSNDYISFKVPAGYTAAVEEGSDIISPATPNGDSISVLFSNKDGSFDQLTKEGFETELKTIDPNIALQNYTAEKIDGVDSVHFSYTVNLDPIKINITQIILNTEPNLTITVTDFTGTSTADFAALLSSIDVK
ncbi:MAG: hypothetical protein E7655_05590 [Ruminococcaceae bacterium]|nr:hypothetical protein [Oscillospiraceae bacterium]